MTIGVIDRVAPLGAFPVADAKDIASVYASQSVWYVDPIAGLDTNTGASSGTALQTCHEARRRLRMQTLALYEIHVLNDLPSTDYIGLDPIDRDTQTGSVQPRVFWYGQRTVVRSATFTANATAAVPASQQPPTFTDSGVPTWYSTHGGKLVIVTSGASVGATTWCYPSSVPAVGAGISNCSPWHVSTYTTGLVPGLTPATPPLSGDSYQVVSLTLVRRAVFSGRVDQTFINFDFTGMAALTDSVFVLGANVAFSTCKLTHFMRPVQCTLSLHDCFVDGGSAITNPAQTGLEFFMSRVNVYFSCGGNTHFNAIFTPRFSRLLSHYGLFQGRFLIIERSYAELSAENGIFLSSYQGVVTDSSLLQFFGNTYGTNHVQATLAVKQSQIVKRIGAVIYLTGTIELSINLRTNFIPPLVGGAVVPAAAPMTTWAQLIAAPFNGNCIDVEGTSITTAVV